MTARVTRTTAFCAICAWVIAVSVAGTLAQMYGLWHWTPTPDAARAAACILAAACVAVLLIPAEEVEES